MFILPDRIPIAAKFRRRLLLHRDAAICTSMRRTHAGLYQQVNDQYVLHRRSHAFSVTTGRSTSITAITPVSSVNGEPVYCYIDGPHFHAWEPPSDGYKVKSGVAFLTSVPTPPGYAKVKPQRVRMVNAEYRP